MNFDYFFEMNPIVLRPLKFGGLTMVAILAKLKLVPPINFASSYYKSSELLTLIFY